MQTKLGICAIIIALSLNSNCAFAQFGITPGTGGAFGRTFVGITGVGVGFFPFATPTNARFHINNFYCNLPGGALNGLLFRTDGNIGVNNSWSMFTGTAPGVLTSLERFNFTVPAGTSDLRIETVQNGSTIFFRNGPGIDVMQVNSNGGPGNGNVWIRKNVAHAFYNPAFLDIGGPIAFSAAAGALTFNNNIF